jgi:formylglycine-generating enzyme required for sulfatase activity
VMEIVEGRLLRELLAESVFDYRRAVDILCQVCAAIQVAHNNRVIHRDLKPDNIIVVNPGEKETVKVLDFGIAKMLEANQPADEQQILTKRGMLIGTPQYMSPEQCQGKDLEPTSDLYSLGLIAYEMLSGRMPFTSATPMGFIAKHMREEPAPLRSIAPHVPSSIERVIMRTLEKEPENRPSSATALADALRAAVLDAGQQSVRTTMIELGSREKDTQTFTSAIPTPVVSAKRTHPDPMEARETAGDIPIPVPIRGKDTQVIEAAPTPKPIAESKSRTGLFAGLVALALVLGVVAYFVITRKPAPPGPDPRGNSQVYSDQFGKMMLIPGGEISIGSPDGDADERPVYRATIKPFFLDETEVTNDQYKKCVVAGRCPSPTSWENGNYPPEEALHPVTHVTWNAATAFAQFAGKRLPKEQEWEYAARGGKEDFIYPWGARWIAGAANVDRGSVTKPAPVSSFKQDQVLGVYDLVGNVSEWVEDDYATYVDHFPIKICVNCKVFRGGNFIDEIKDSRGSKRWAIQAKPLKPYDEVVGPKLGFRCAKDVQ